MRKFILVAATVATLAVPAAASADAPNGNYPASMKDGVTVDNYGHQVTPNNASIIGEFSARSIQNGQFISGNSGTADQTTTPGSRADALQALLVNGLDK